MEVPILAAESYNHHLLYTSDALAKLRPIVVELRYRQAELAAEVTRLLFYGK